MSQPAQAPNVPNVSTLKDADYSKMSELEKIFKAFKKVSDPRFGEIFIIQNPQTRQFLAVKEKKITDKKEAGQCILYARKRVNLKHPFILNLVDYSVSKQSELCSSFYIIKYFFEYPKTDLRKEMTERERVGEEFSDVELTHLLYQQVMAGSFLQAKDVVNGDIQPLHIGFDRDGPVSKLIEKFDEVSGNLNKTKQMQKNNLISGKPLYQSPLTYSNLKKGNLNYSVNQSKEDAFALGLTFLEAGNGRSVQNIYDAKAGVVNKDALKAHQDAFANKYGGPNLLLPKAVLGLTAYEEADRLGFRDLEGRLPDYEQVKLSLASAQRGSKPPPIVLDKVVRDKVMSTPAPDLYASNPGINEVQPSLVADPYSHYVQVNAQPTTEYSFVPSTQDKRIVNMADYSGQETSYTQPTNYTYTTYEQPQNMTYVYAQPYDNFGQGHQYVVQGMPGDYNGQTTSYYMPGQTNYVYAQPVEGDLEPIQGQITRNETVVKREVIVPDGSQNPNLGVPGLKLVKTYMDPKFATDKPNY